MPAAERLYWVTAVAWCLLAALLGNARFKAVCTKFKLWVVVILPVGLLSVASFDVGLFGRSADSAWRSIWAWWMLPLAMAGQFMVAVVTVLLERRRLRQQKLRGGLAKRPWLHVRISPFGRK
jgi:hypothetical protein